MQILIKRNEILKNCRFNIVAYHVFRPLALLRKEQTPSNYFHVMTSSCYEGKIHAAVVYKLQGAISLCELLDLKKHFLSLKGTLLLFSSSKITIEGFHKIEIRRVFFEGVIKLIVLGCSFSLPPLPHPTGLTSGSISRRA